MALSVTHQIVFDLKYATENDRIFVELDDGQELTVKVESTLYTHLENAFILDPASYPAELIELSESIARHFAKLELRTMSRRPFMRGLSEKAKFEALKSCMLENVRLVGTNQPKDRRHLTDHFNSAPINLGLELVARLQWPYERLSLSGRAYEPKHKLDVTIFGQSPFIWYSNAKITGIRVPE